MSVKKLKKVPEVLSEDFEEDELEEPEEADFKRPAGIQGTPPRASDKMGFRWLIVFTLVLLICMGFAYQHYQTELDNPSSEPLGGKPGTNETTNATGNETSNGNVPEPSGNETAENETEHEIPPANDTEPENETTPETSTNDTAPGNETVPDGNATEPGCNATASDNGTTPTNGNETAPGNGTLPDNGNETANGNLTGNETGNETRAVCIKLEGVVRYAKFDLIATDYFITKINIC